METDNCVKCEKLLPDGEGRYNFPSGSMCTLCGHPISLLLEEAEDSIKKYNKLTGSGARIRFCDL